MLSVFQFNESSPSHTTGTVASSQAVTNTDPNSAAGVLSSSGLEEALGLSFISEIHEDSADVLDVYVQSFLLGVWYDIAHFKQLPMGSSTIRNVLVAGPGYSANSTTIGAGSAPALAADTVVGGPWGEAFRLMMVPGASAAGGSAVKVTVVVQLPRQWGR